MRHPKLGEALWSTSTRRRSRVKVYNLLLYMRGDENELWSMEYGNGTQRLREELVASSLCRRDEARRDETREKLQRIVYRCIDVDVPRLPSTDDDSAVRDVEDAMVYASATLARGHQEQTTQLTLISRPSLFFLYLSLCSCACRYCCLLYSSNQDRRFTRNFRAFFHLSTTSLRFIAHIARSFLALRLLPFFFSCV